MVGDKPGRGDRIMEELKIIDDGVVHGHQRMAGTLWPIESYVCRDDSPAHYGCKRWKLTKRLCNSICYGGESEYFRTKKEAISALKEYAGIY